MGSPTDYPLQLPSGIADAVEAYRRAFGAGLRPDRAYTVSEWADEHRMLSRVAASEHGRWQTRRTPYLRDIMDALSPSDPCQEVTFVKGTQLGGSEAGYNWLAAIIDIWPAPTMLVMPTTDTAKRISKQRLAPMIDETPSLRSKISEAKSRDSGNTVLMKDFPGGALILTGANSGPGLRSMPIRFLMMDEVDAYPSDVDGEGDPCIVAEKRTDTFSRRKIFRCSSPKLKATSRIERFYEASDQRRYHVPCPHCEHEQWLKWDGIRWETAKVWEVTRADDGEIVEVEPDTEGATERDTGDVVRAWYECEACQGEILEHHKTKMLESGRWIAARPGANRHPGFHLSALYSPVGWFSWHQAVQQYLAAEGDLSGELAQVFSNTVLGEAYDDAGEQPDEHELKRHVGEYRLGGKVPLGALMLTAGVDVQHDRLEARVWGWGRGEESWLVHREIIHGSPAEESTWMALKELLFREWDHAGGKTLTIRATAIDAGDGNTTHHVRQFCRTYAAKHVIATKGQAVAGKPIIGRPTEQDVNHRGKMYKNAVKLWPMGSDTAKALLYSRFKIDEPGPGYVHLPQGLPDSEFSEMTAEKVVTRYVKGFPRREWTKKPGDRNEGLDCAVLAIAAAHYAGLTRVNWQRLEQQLIPPPSPGVPQVTPADQRPPTAAPPGEDTPKTQPAARGLFVARPRRTGGFATNW
jgi:phage terminase large subunit GpA-like protein